MTCIAELDNDSEIVYCFWFLFFVIYFYFIASVRVIPEVGAGLSHELPVDSPILDFGFHFRSN